jgi:hypothetical protein
MIDQKRRRKRRKRFPGLLDLRAFPLWRLRDVPEPLLVLDPRSLDDFAG